MVLDVSGFLFREAILICALLRVTIYFSLQKHEGSENEDIHLLFLLPVESSFFLDIAVHAAYSMYFIVELKWDINANLGTKIGMKLFRVCL